MPKRTDEFQRLIYHIYDQMATQSARVTESAFLRERDGGEEREVDVLIEDEIAGETVRMAVECRNRGRRASVEWIDQIIGKFRDLDVHKIIAVSRSGFSAPAEAKAAANNIETRTLQEALETDWPEEFMRLGIGKVTYLPSLRGVKVETEPELAGMDDISGNVEDGHRNALGTLRDVILDAFRSKVQIGAWEYLLEKMPELYETVEDFGTKTLLVTHRVLAPDLYLVDDGGTRRKIVALTFELAVRLNFEPSLVKRRLYRNQAQVTTSVLRLGEDKTAYSVDIVQAAGQNDGKMLIRPAEKNDT